MINKRILSLMLAAFAASLFLAVGLFFALGNDMQNDMQSGHVIATDASQWDHRTLKDGSDIHIDARSRVKIEYTDAARIVTVEQGGAVFEVAKDPKRPFIARTHLVDVTAVGTRFGVSINPGVTTTVSEGIVKVTARGYPGTASGIMLYAGEELRVPDGGDGEPAHVKVDAERRLEWATGWLVFEDKTIGEVVNELNRRNAVQIEIEQPDIAARPMRGIQRFRVDSSAAIARYIADTHDLALIEDRSESVLRLRSKQHEGY